MIQERRRTTLSGWLALAVLVPVLVYSFVALVQAARAHDGTMVIVWALVMVLDIVLLFGLFMVAPNEGGCCSCSAPTSARVRDAGAALGQPLLHQAARLAAVRNFESGKLKVNDTDGNPIEIAAVVVWQVVDTAEALLRGGRLRGLRPRPERGRGAQPGDALPLRRPRGRRDVPARQHRRRSPSELQARDPGAPRPRPASRSSRPASATWPTPRRSPRPCCGASRRAPSSRRARRSSRAPSAWSRWRSSSSPSDAGRRARRGAQGRHGQQPAGRAVRRRRGAAGGQHRHALPVGAPWPSARRSCSASTRACTTALQRWADDDLRSLNGQIEFLLRRALRETGRLRDEKSGARDR